MAFDGRFRVLVVFVGIMLELESHLLALISVATAAVSTFVGAIGVDSNVLFDVVDLSALVSVSSVGTSSNML